MVGKRRQDARDTAAQRANVTLYGVVVLSGRRGAKLDPKGTKRRCQREEDRLIVAADLRDSVTVGSVVEPEE